MQGKGGAVAPASAVIVRLSILAALPHCMVLVLLSEFECLSLKCSTNASNIVVEILTGNARELQQALTHERPT